jgi:hypothetical protein
MTLELHTLLWRYAYITLEVCVHDFGDMFMALCVWYMWVLMGPSLKVWVCVVRHNLGH